MLEMIRTQLHSPGPSPHRPANQTPPRELGEKGNKCVKESEGIEKLAPRRVRRMSLRPMPPRPTLLRPTLARTEKPRKKPRKKSQRRDVGRVPP